MAPVPEKNRKQLIIFVIRRKETKEQLPNQKITGTRYR